MATIHDIIIRIKAVQTGIQNSLKPIQQRLEGIEKSTKQVAKTTQQATGHMRKFRFEMLGVMFFGQMLAQTFSNLLQPALDTFGVFDLWGTSLQVVFLPTVEKLFPYFEKITNALMNMPDPVKNAAGAFAFLGLGLGTLLSTIGTFTLGLAAMAMAFGGPGAGAATLGASLSSIGTAIMGIMPWVLLIAAVAYLVYQAWQDNFLNIRMFVEMAWNGIKDIFMGAFNFISGIIKALLALLRGDTKGFIDGIKQAFDGFVQFMKGGPELIIGILATITLAILNFGKNILKVAWEIGVGLVNGIIDGIKSIGNKIGEVLSGFFGGDKAKVNVGTTPSKSFGDMIWRPGSAPVAISPNDTLVASKSGGAGGATIVFSPVYNVSGSSKMEVEAVLKEYGAKQVDELRRLAVKVRG